MTTTLRANILSSFCTLADSADHRGTEWHRELVRLAIFIMGYTHEGVKVVEGLESHCMYGPDFEKAADIAADTVLWLHSVTDADSHESKVLWHSKRRFVGVLRALSYDKVGDWVEATQAGLGQRELAPRSAHA